MLHMSGHPCRCSSVQLSVLCYRTLVETGSLLCSFPPPLHSNCSKLVYAGLAGKCYTVLTGCNYYMLLFTQVAREEEEEGGGVPRGSRDP